MLSVQYSNTNPGIDPLQVITAKQNTMPHFKPSTQVYGTPQDELHCLYLCAKVLAIYNYYESIILIPQIILSGDVNRAPISL